MLTYCKILIIFFLSCFCCIPHAKSTAIGDHLKIGSLQFATSTHSPSAQAHFILGVKYLHNFMYPLALREFTLARKDDPAFALSYWGQAMCYKWSLWSI